jgi:hypothetical protein
MAEVFLKRVGMVMEKQFEVGGWKLGLMIGETLVDEWRRFSLKESEW